MNINAAFVGGGNMGGALIRGLIARGLPPQQISVGEAHQQRRIALADELGVHVTADNREAVARADVVVLAVKPARLEDCTSIASVIKQFWIDANVAPPLEVIDRSPQPEVFRAPATLPRA